MKTLHWLNLILRDKEFHVREHVIDGGIQTFQHSHDYYELFLVTGGQLYHLINNREELVVEGSLRLVLPEDIHYYRTARNRTGALVNFAFTPDLYYEALTIFNSYAETEPESRSVQLPFILSQTVQSKLSCLSNGFAGMFSLSMRDLAIGILLDCLCFLRGGKGQHPTAPPMWLIKACDTVQKDKGYITGIEKLVKLSGRTQEHLTRVMKKHYGITPSIYINRLRLGEAARLLKATRRSVLDIQLDCGFGSTSHFNKLFKAEYGASPSQYRLLNKVTLHTPDLPG